MRHIMQIFAKVSVETMVICADTDADIRFLQKVQKKQNADIWLCPLLDPRRLRRAGIHKAQLRLREPLHFRKATKQENLS